MPEMFDGRKIKVEVTQLPPVEYSLNWRGHWRQRYLAGKVYGDAVFYSCVNARNITGQPFAKARLDLTFVFAQRRRRDRDNLLARFKPGQDAIVHAGLLLDDDAEHLEIGEIVPEVDPEKAPMTIIKVSEVVK